MRTSLNDIKKTDDFLTGRLRPEDSVLFKAKLLLDPLLRWNVALQEQTHELVQFYGRRKLKSEIRATQQKIFNDPGKASFRNAILHLFSKL